MLNWCKSYLCNRKQYVVTACVESQLQIISCGVPQGSILGPLLFLIYMNDIYNATSSFQFILFADDTSVFMSDNNLYNLCTRFNYELDKLSKWLSVNKLVLNTKKTNYMVFTNRYINTNIDIKIGDENIKCVPSLKFLGITIDNKLTWHEHIGVVCTRVSKGVGILNDKKR